MKREVLALLVGIFGNISSTLVFASPLVTFYHIIKKKNTESFSPVPYVTCMLSQVLWIYYGILKPKGLLIVTISAVGLFFEIFYLCVFVMFAAVPQRIFAFKLLSLSLIAFVAIFLSTFLGSSGTHRLSIVGLLSAINSICMFASPLCVMKKVITTKSVEYMPFFLTLSLVINGGTWTTYAIIVMDFFMMVPNGIGFMFGVLQVLLYSLYYKKKPYEVQGTKSLDENYKPTTNDHKISLVKVEDFYKKSQAQTT